MNAEQNWEETARQYCRNANYYRDLVVRCGQAFGLLAQTCDDGSLVEDVLCAKVPELVQEALKARDQARAEITKLEAVIASFDSEACDVYFSTEKLRKENEQLRALNLECSRLASVEAAKCAQAIAERDQAQAACAQLRSVLAKAQ